MKFNIDNLSVIFLSMKTEIIHIYLDHQSDDNVASNPRRHAMTLEIALVFSSQFSMSQLNICGWKSLSGKTMMFFENYISEI